ncbi:hypothetical protein Q5P01_001750 [Channa striata]|uniref:Uncharacterized protein n=1 Tax=Channa striata TaxID=64152 RepID=A0AA88T475_CHASR|nr:hypothetical protein Q5P01_001750 [Channa striata]
MQASSPDIKQAWLTDVVQILESQKNFLNALQSPIEYQRRENKSHSLGRNIKYPTASASGLRPRSSASMDRRKQPCLQSYNTSLPSLHPPKQSPATKDSYSLDVRPQAAHCSLSSHQQLGLCTGLRHDSGTSNGLPLCSPNSTQVIPSSFQVTTFNEADDDT